MNPSASNIHRFLECQWPYNGQPWPNQDPSEAASNGTRIHEILASRPGLREVTFAYDWKQKTSRAVGLKLGRDYRGILETELAGTADYIDQSCICDYKTGRHPPNAEGNSQLLFLALCANKTGYQIQYIEIQSVDDSGELIHADVYELGPFDLDAFEAQLQSVLANPSPTPKPGPHCKYCPVIGVCPAATAAITDMASKYPLALFDHQSITSDEHAEFLLHRIATAKEVIARVEALVKSYGPIKLSNGKTYGPAIATRESIRGSYQELIDAGVPSDIIDVSVTKASIESHAGNARKARDFVAALRAANLVKDVQFTKWVAK